MIIRLPNNTNISQSTSSQTVNTVKLVNTLTPQKIPDKLMTQPAMIYTRSTPESLLVNQIYTSLGKLKEDDSMLQKKQSMETLSNNQMQNQATGIDKNDPNIKAFQKIDNGQQALQQASNARGGGSGSSRWYIGFRVVIKF